MLTFFVDDVWSMNVYALFCFINNNNEISIYILYEHNERSVMFRWTSNLLLSNKLRLSDVIRRHNIEWWSNNFSFKIRIRMFCSSMMNTFPYFIETEKNILKKLIFSFLDKSNNNICWFRFFSIFFGWIKLKKTHEVCLLIYPLDG